MKTIGSLILLLSIAMLTIVGTITFSDTVGEVQKSNNSFITAQASGGESVLTSILTVFGYLALIVGSMIAVNSFR
jgi:hypothetical protein